MCYCLRNVWDGRTGTCRYWSNWPAVKSGNCQQSRAVDTTIAPITRLNDMKSLLQVTPYRGDKASFLGWKWSFLIAVRAISEPLYEGLKKIEDNMNQDFRKSRLSNEDLELLEQMYTLLALLCKDEACACVRSAEDGNGYQAWQALLRARTARNATNVLNQLLEPKFPSPDPPINLRQWNKNAEEYATRTAERVSDGIRRAVYMNKIAPQDMRRHFDVESVPSEYGWGGCPGNWRLLGCNRGVVVHGRFFSVGEVICLVTLFDDRDRGLLNHVKFDSCLITSQRDRSRTHPWQ